MRKRRYTKSDFEKTEVKRKAVLKQYKNREYIPSEQAVINLIELFFPLLESNLEEEAWSVCSGDNSDQDAKEIVKQMKQDVKIFLCKYGRQLKQIALNDPIYKNQEKINQILQNGKTTNNKQNHKEIK